MFNVLDAVKGCGPLISDLLQELQHIIRRRAFLIEVAAIEPFTAATVLLSGAGNVLHRNDAIDIPVQIVAIELDLEMGEFRNCLRDGQSRLAVQEDVDLASHLV